MFGLIRGLGRVDLIDQRVALAREHGPRMPSRQLARQVDRAETHPHEPADDDSPCGPPVAHLRLAGRPHGDVQPVIEPLAELRIGLQDGHRVPLTIGGGTELFHQRFGEGAAHA